MRGCGGVDTRTLLIDLAIITNACPLCVHSDAQLSTFFFLSPHLYYSLYSLFLFHTTRVTSNTQPHSWSIHVQLGQLIPQVCVSSPSTPLATCRFP